MPKRSAALIYGPELHHLDHLAPICLLLNIPLIVTEQELADLAKHYYPSITVTLLDYLSIGEALVKNFEVIFYSMPRALFDELFFFTQKFHHKPLQTVWCPHGNSDKGQQTYFMEALNQERMALLYGQKMIDFLKQKNAFDNLKSYVVTGNFRSTFYKREKPFYDGLVRQEILKKLPQAKQTFLYAPTWQDYEKSTSFFSACAPIIDHIDDETNLLIKLHPNLCIQYKHQIDEIVTSYQKKKNVLFLSEFPPIYPLLNIADVYIGDMSSIGYDFLTFNRPLVFLNQNEREGIPLFQCGITIKPAQYPDICRLIDFETRDFTSIRQEVYNHTFGPEKEWDALKREIVDMVQSTAEDDLHFM